MTVFAKRNIRLYFRDRGAVLYSLLGVMIVVGLYALFLSENLVSSLPPLPQAKLFVNSWLMAGVCAIAPVTTGLGAMGTLILDRASHINYDYLSSPVGRAKLVVGYLAAGLAAAGLMSLITLGLGMAWLLWLGMAMPGPGTLLAILGTQLLAVLSGGSMMFFITTLFQSSAAFSAASTVVGVVTGFLTGVYLPVGLLPEPVQVAVKLFPTSHVASLLRSFLVEGPAATMFAGAPADVKDTIFKNLGIRYQFGDELLPLWGSAAIAAASALLFFLLALLCYHRRQRAIR